MNPAQTDVPVLEFQNLSVGYGSKVVLANLTQQVFAGQFVCLLGPNGAGKTTLLRTLAGLQPALSGEIRLGGRVYESLDSNEIARELAAVLTDRPSVQLLTALELVCLGRHPHTGFLGRLGQEDLRQARLAMEMVGAWDLAGRFLDQLSDGERQKLMLARALAQQPRLILLDEPTMHLDVKHRLEVMSILRALCREQGISVVASLHDVDLAVRLADVAALVHQGGISAWGPPEQTLDAESLVSLYGLEQARYLPGLGVIEPPMIPNRPAVFVACGGGSGAMALRLLAKRGFALRSGVLHEHDLDCQVAQALGGRAATLPPFIAVGPESLDQARDLAADCLAMLDTGFPVGADNRANLELLTWAEGRGIPLLSLRSPDAMEHVLGRTPEGCFFHRSAGEAAAALESMDGTQDAAA